MRRRRRDRRSMPRARDLRPASARGQVPALLRAFAGSCLRLWRVRQRLARRCRRNAARLEPGHWVSCGGLRVVEHLLGLAVRVHHAVDGESAVLLELREAIEQGFTRPCDRGAQLGLGQQIASRQQGLGSDDVAGMVLQTGPDPAGEGARRGLARPERFQAKWTPVRRSKMRLINYLERFCDRNQD